MVIHPKLPLCVLLWRPRKEFQVDHGHLHIIADKFQWVFSESWLNACSTDMMFCRRMRTITPLRLGLALTATCASQRIDTRANFYRGFNALFHTIITHKVFYNQIAKPYCAVFIRTMTERLVGEMTLKGCDFAKGVVFVELRPIFIHDGSSFTIHDALREVFPGRFQVGKPAAVEFPPTLDLWGEAPTTGVLTPDTTSEQVFLPEPPVLRGSVLRADRGYVNYII